MSWLLGDGGSVDEDDTSPDGRLKKAVVDKNPTGMKEAIAAGADVRQTFTSPYGNGDGISLVEKAAKEADARAVHILLEAGAPPGDALLAVAGRYNCDPMTVALLLRAGADPTARDNNGKTAEELARERGNGESVAKLLDDVAQDPTKLDAAFAAWSQLFSAAETNNVDAFRAAVDNVYGLVNFVRVETDDNLTPVMAACAAGSADVLAFVLEKFDCGVSADYVGLACASGSLETVQAAVDWRSDYTGRVDEDGNTPLHVAAEAGHANIVDFLLDARAFLRANDAGETALDLAIRNGHQACVDLLAPFKGYDPDAEEPPADLEYPNTYLFIMTKRRSHACMREAVANGADIDWQDTFGTAAVHKVVTDSMCLEAALDLGANPDVVDRAGCTPLHRAVMEENVNAAKTLLKAGAHPMLADKRGKVPMDYCLETMRAELAPAFETAINLHMAKVEAANAPAAQVAGAETDHTDLQDAVASLLAWRSEAEAEIAANKAQIAQLLARVEALGGGDA